MYYLIENTLRECQAGEWLGAKKQFVAILTPEEWQRERESFDMGIDMDLDILDVHTTKAEVNYDSVTGTLSLPDRNDMDADDRKLAFALDEKGIVFIDAGDTAMRIISRIKETRKWRLPSLERFIYDFLEQIIHTDLSLLERYEGELDEIDKEVAEDRKADLVKLDDIRWYLRELKRHYDHLIDLAQELEENENNFFKANNIRYFKLFSSRVSRLYDMVNSLLDYSMQIRDTYESKLDVKQNSIMTVLTMVTTIFMPLTLIAGWYGMNFRYMPELESKFGYPGVIIVSILIAAGCLIYFKHKKWL
ncbi:MAG: magnesium transporter CorA [Lachnospiraceae bacterium]|nr:magnesium transporter CorA [Lachnospiraceae bacterium]